MSRVIQVTGSDTSQKHFSALYRFFSRAKWSTDEVGHVLFQLLLRWSPQRIEVLVDDTLCRHGGLRIFGAAMHRDPLASNYGRGTSAGATTRFACGHSWVVLAMRIPLPWDTERGIAVPFLFRLYRSKKHCEKELYRKRAELARDLMLLVESWIPSGYQLVAVGDSEYASRNVVRSLGSKTAFVGPTLKNAALHAEPGKYSGRGRPRKKGKRLASPTAMAEDKSVPWHEITAAIYGRDVKLQVKSWTCLWPTVAGQRLVRIVVTRDPKGRADDRAYFSTDSTMDPQAIIETYTRRWLIEVCFRDSKQLLGLEDPQNGWSKGKRVPKKERKLGVQARGERGALAVTRTVPIAFTAQAIVIIWFLEEGDGSQEVQHVRKNSPWYRKKKRPSFRDMLVALRRETWAARLFGHPPLEGGAEEISRLLPDAMLAA